MPSRRTIKKQAELQNANLANRGVQQPNPNAAYVEQNTLQNFNSTTASPEQIARHEEAVRLATAQGQTPAQRTAATRRPAGAPLVSPNAGAGGRAGALGFNDAAGGVAPQPGGMGVVNQTQRDPATPDPRAALFGNETLGEAIAGGRISEGEVQRRQQQEEFDRKQKESDTASQALGGSKDGANREEQQVSPDMAPLMAKLPPELQGMASFIQASLDESKNLIAENQSFVEGQMQSIQDQYAPIEQKYKDMEQNYLQTSSAIQGIIDSIKDDNEQMIAEERGAQEARLQHELQREERKLADQKTKAHESMVAQIALMGGFGQDAGLAAVRESDAAYEAKMSDLREEFRVENLELSAKFTALYVQNKNDYRDKSMTNLKDLVAGLERVGLQSISSQEARNTAERGLMQSAWDNEVTLRQGLADKNLSVAEKIQDVIAESKKSKEEREDKLWNRLFEQRAADGNLNPGLTQRILDDMNAAGIDTKGIDPNAMTLEQANEVARAAKESEKNAGGKQLLSSQVKSITEFDTALSNVRSLEATLDEYTDVGGPFSGRIGALPGLESFSETAARQRELQAVNDRVKQFIGKAMEGGVLRKEDEAKYERILPTIKDTDRTRKFKIQEIKREIEYNKQSILQNLMLSGYDVSGYDMGDPLDVGEPSSLTNDEAQEILEKADSGEPLSADTPTGFLDTLARAHMKHEGYGTANAKTITEGNNPGALRWHPAQAQFGGTKGPKNFTVFPDFNSGYRALVADLRAKIGGKSAHIDYSSNPTLLSYVQVYAPTADGNNPKGYAAALVKALREKGYNVDLETPLSQLNYLIS